MADKLTDEEIANELERFGETIKLPIDYKKRPILIKKLNHYKAKENPPVKRSKSGGRQPRKPVAPHAEFSDDSQDDTELIIPATKYVPKSFSVPKSKVPTPGDRPSRSLRSRNSGVQSSPVQAVAKTTRAGLQRQTAKNKRLSQVRQLELYAEEFSDTDPDTADESLYEVEEKGINTTLAFDDTFDDDHDVSGYGTKSPLKQPNSTRSITVDPVHAMPLQNEENDSWIYTNHVENDGKPKPKRKNETESMFNRKEQFVSKTILTVLAVFFLFLGVSYVCLKTDIFLWREPALQEDLKERFCEQTVGKDSEKECYSTAEGSKALAVIRHLHKKLARLKGQYELGSVDEDQSRLGINDVNAILKDKFRTEEDKERLAKLCLLLIVKNPTWDIKVFSSDGSPAVTIDEVDHMESAYGDLPLSTRLSLSLFRVLYGLFLLACCVAVGVLGMFYLRWQTTKKEKAQRKVYDMVERIIDSLKENAEVSERKNDPKNYPAYMAVQHIRDQLIPIAQRKRMQALWDEAVQFIEANESRIRVETQMIHGEEFTVWRWLQTFPNGGRQWQGQAFGETSQTVNMLPYGPTPCLKVRNMFDGNSERVDADWHVDIEDAILEKCKGNDGILHMHVDRGARECVYIKCSSCENAYEACQSLHGWWFDGRLITVKYLRLEHYHERFPESRNRKYPLRPSNNDMQSVARPYHKSALEMT